MHHNKTVHVGRDWKKVGPSRRYKDNAECFCIIQNQMGGCRLRANPTKHGSNGMDDGMGTRTSRYQLEEFGHSIHAIGLPCSMRRSSVVCLCFLFYDPRSNSTIVGKPGRIESTISTTRVNTWTVGIIKICNQII